MYILCLMIRICGGGGSRGWQREAASRWVGEDIAQHVDAHINGRVGMRVG